MENATLEVVIKTTSMKGDGTENNPYRRVVQYWTLEGKLLHEETDV